MLIETSLVVTPVPVVVMPDSVLVVTYTGVVVELVIGGGVTMLPVEVGSRSLVRLSINPPLDVGVSVGVEGAVDGPVIPSVVGAVVSAGGVTILED